MSILSILLIPRFPEMKVKWNSRHLEKIYGFSKNQLLGIKWVEITVFGKNLYFLKKATPVDGFSMQKCMAIKVD